jgi:serine/threonine-protein kinase
MEKAVPPPSAAASPVTVAALDGSQDLSGRVIGDYRVLRKLGQGGMGQVFLAEQLSLKRQVALKIMRPDLTANATALRRFQLEAEAVAKIAHGNIVQVYHYGVVDGLHFMALEYVEGRNLREYLAKKGSPDLLVSLSVMRQVAAALQRASEVGIVHRDIKPENILLTKKGEVKVTDFGLSRCLAGSEQQAAHLTQSGVSMGTPLYMSPEQVQGKETDPRTDIYSFGVTCYHMLAGQPPYRGASAVEVAIQHVQNTPQPLAEIRPDLPAELCQIVHKMMAKNPEERYQTARDLFRDLTVLREGLGTQQTQAVQKLSQSTAIRLSNHSVKVTTAAPTTPRRDWRRMGLTVAVVLSLGVAAAAGAGLRTWRERSQPVASPPEGKPGDVSLPREPAAPDPHEQALVEALRKTPREPDEHRRYREQAVQLGTLYLNQRRLDDADRFFKGLHNNPDHYVQALGRIGQPIVLAFRDQARASNELFLELEKKRPNVPPGPVIMAQLPEYALLHRPQVRRLVSEALNCNAANIAPEALPEALERLRRIPPPRGPEKSN